MKLSRCLWATLCVVWFVSGCGGGGGGHVAPTEPPWVRGTLLQSPPLRTASFTAADLQQRLSAGSTRDKALLELSGDPLCGVDVQSIQYTTVGGLQEHTTASGALLLPTGTDPQCSGQRPVVLYAHGTNPDKTYNLASLTSDGNASYSEGLMLAAFYAAQGYIVVAPNYAGYDSSALAYHPFLVADQQSKDMMDALTAARTALAALGSSVRAGSKLFVTGYSEGGHVAMATHRALQQAGIAVTASAPMSGPYALAAQADWVFYGHVYLGSTLFAPLLTSSYQAVYRNLYATPADYYESAYADGIASLLPGADAATLISSGKLPQYALFSRTPPAAAAGSALQKLLAVATPPVGTTMDPVFDKGFGAGNLITNSARLAYLQDAMNNPDGLVPTLGSGLPATAPQNPLRVATRLNDLRGWTPATPLLLCGGNEDPTVPFDINTKAMAALWTGLPAGLVTVLDVDSRPANAGDPYRAEKLAFALLKTVIIATAQLEGKDPASEVAGNYHAGLLPFCTSAARTFFAGL